jgi:hypothetical protein
MNDHEQAKVLSSALVALLAERLEWASRTEAVSAEFGIAGSDRWLIVADTIARMIDLAVIKHRQDLHGEGSAP